MNLDQITQWAAGGESETLEFKRTTGERREATRALCGMLNHRGGRVLFGIEPDGSVIGQQVSDHTIEEVAQERRSIDPPAFPSIDGCQSGMGERSSWSACQLVKVGLTLPAGLSPFAPAAAAIKAGKLMLQEIKGYAARRESFAFETTLSGLGYLRHIKDWRSSGYHVTIFLLTLPSVEIAIARVAARVSQGGHDIPEAVIRRRFVSGVRNFNAYYRDAVDSWAAYDNSGEQPVLTHWSENV